MSRRWAPVAAGAAVAAMGAAGAGPPVAHAAAPAIQAPAAIVVEASTGNVLFARRVRQRRRTSRSRPKS